MQRTHGTRRESEAKLLNNTSKALKRLETNGNGGRYSNKQRAKDYDTAIRNLGVLRAKQITQTRNNLDAIKSNTNKIKNEKDQAKVRQYMTDNALLSFSVNQAAKKYERYNSAANEMIKRMSNDKMVVYTTRYRQFSSNSAPNEIETFYDYYNTDYKVKAKTKSRAKSKRYNDPNKKKQYGGQLVKRRNEYIWV